MNDGWFNLVDDVLRYMLAHFVDPITTLMLSMTCHRAHKTIDMPPPFPAFRPEDRAAVLERFLMRHGTLELIQKYAPPNGAYDPMAYGPAIAIERNHLPLLQWLLVKVHCRITNKMPPRWHLLSAARLGHWEIFQWLAVGYGTDMITSECFRYACSQGNLPMAQWMFQRHPFPYSKSVVMLVMMNGHLDVWKWLCQADVGYFERCGRDARRIVGKGSPNAITQWYESMGVRIRRL